MSERDRSGGFECRYESPPVIEALCELAFAGTRWDATVPGAFYERVRDTYPTKRERRVREASIALHPQHTKTEVRDLPSWMQYVSETDRRMVQIAPDMLVVNQLAPPYPGFEAWEPEVYRMLDLYCDLATPAGITRLGLRYINRIVIPKEILRMEDYFTVYPRLPDGIGDTHGAFVVRLEVPGPEEGHTTAITFGTAPPVPADSPGGAFVLDLHHVVRLGGAPKTEAVRAALQDAHVRIGTTFEGSITDRLRDLFGRVEGA